MNIRNIIFDLGGVLLNIDYEATIKAFRKLGVQDFEDFFTQAGQVHLFDRLDRGELTPQEFNDSLRRLSGINLADHDIEAAWNAMLLDLPSERISLLKGLREHYNIYLLSNTNAIHYPAYMQTMKETFGVESLEDLFEKQYLSHLIGMRKPDAAPFELILRENGLKAAETLFIDDTMGHVKGAAATGIRALWLDLKQMDVMDVFTEDHRVREEVISRLAD